MDAEASWFVVLEYAKHPIGLRRRLVSICFSGQLFLSAIFIQKNNVFCHATNFETTHETIGFDKLPGHTLKRSHPNTQQKKMHLPYPVCKSVGHIDNVFGVTEIQGD